MIRFCYSAQTGAGAGNSSQGDPVTAAISGETGNVEATSEANNSPAITTAIAPGDSTPGLVTTGK